MKDKRFPLVIEVSFDVPYWQNVSGMTNQQLADYVNACVEAERCELVIAAKTCLIHALSGEFEDEGLHGLLQEPGSSVTLALGAGTDVNGTPDSKQVGRFARVWGLVRANGRQVGSWITGG